MCVWVRHHIVYQIIYGNLDKSHVCACRRGGRGWARVVKEARGSREEEGRRVGGAAHGTLIWSISMGAQITELSRVIRQLFLLILCADRHTNTHVHTYKSRMYTCCCCCLCNVAYKNLSRSACGKKLSDFNKNCTHSKAHTHNWKLNGTEERELEREVDIKTRYSFLFHLQFCINENTQNFKERECATNVR